MAQEQHTFDHFQVELAGVQSEKAEKNRQVAVGGNKQGRRDLNFCGVAWHRRVDDGDYDNETEVRDSWRWRWSQWRGKHMASSLCESDVGCVAWSGEEVGSDGEGEVQELGRGVSLPQFDYVALHAFLNVVGGFASSSLWSGGCHQCGVIGKEAEAASCLQVCCGKTTARPKGLGCGYSSATFVVARTSNSTKQHCQRNTTYKKKPTKKPACVKKVSGQSHQTFVGVRQEILNGGMAGAASFRGQCTPLLQQSAKLCPSFV